MRQAALIACTFALVAMVAPRSGLCARGGGATCADRPLPGAPPRAPEPPTPPLSCAPESTGQALDQPVEPSAAPTGPASGLRICFGAFPRQGTKERAGVQLMFRPYEGLERLSEETGLKIRGTIVYLRLERQLVADLRAGRRTQYIAEEDVASLTHMVERGAVLRIALEPRGLDGYDSMRLLCGSDDALRDIAKTLAQMGPCSMRVASELNLYDSSYHISTGSPTDMSQLARAFKTVHDVFSRSAPNVAVTFSPFIPNSAGQFDRQHSLELIAQYVPMVCPHVDMFTGTFYPRSPAEVHGLVAYAGLIGATDKPFGIDELGCRDEATFRTVMDALVRGKAGNPRFINFFDYHVTKPGVDNPWHLKVADKQLLRKLKERGLLQDA